MKREPALLALPVLTTVIGLVAHLLNWNVSTTAIVTAVVVALGAAVTAALARPWHPAALAGAVATVLTLVSHYWLHMSTGFISAVAMAVTLVVGLVVRHQVTPITS
jgi:hypothetical protein